MTLLQGLIYCHDHLANFTYELASRWELSERGSLRHIRIAAVLKQTIETDYTAVRDAGGLDAGFRQAVEEGLIPGPHLQVSLGFITPTGGMADRTSPWGHTPPIPPDSSLPWGVANGSAAMRVKVREMVRAGADVIKTATTGGASSRAGLGPKDMLVTKEELEVRGVVGPIRTASAQPHEAPCRLLRRPTATLVLRLQPHHANPNCQQELADG